MMVNKSGQFFGIYLVLLTLLMCGTVILLYYQQEGNARSELVSPKVVLDIVDGLEVFEMREVELIRNSFNGVSFGKGGFEDEFRVNFLAGIGSDERMLEVIRNSYDGVDVGSGLFANEVRRNFLAGVDPGKKMRDFIFDRLVVGGRGVVETDGFFANVLYPDRLTFVEGSKLYFGRDKVGKKGFFRTSDNTKNYFPVGFTFEFERSYVISEVGGKIEVSKV